MAKGVVVHMKPKNGHSHRSAPAASRPRRKAQAPPPPPPAPAKPRTGMSTKKLIEESRRWLSIINAHKLNDYKRRKIATDTLDNFKFYYNRGYLEYRKSVTEGGEFAAIEW